MSAPTNPTSVPCPQCGAERDVPCLTPTGFTAKRTHAKRIDAYVDSKYGRPTKRG